MKCKKGKKEYNILFYKGGDEKYFFSNFFHFAFCKMELLKKNCTIYITKRKNKHHQLQKKKV
jgi:hypothetical protein